MRRLTTGWRPRIGGMRVGVVDVGANTLRLLVAAKDGNKLVAVGEQRAQLGLGAEIEQNGFIRAERIDQAAKTARAQIRRARKLGCTRVEVLVTSPGRQAANADELLFALARATEVPTRVLPAEEEAALAWRGAVAAEDGLPQTVAVCDVGGGSSQIAVGTSSSSPSWVRSIDLGSLRLTRRAFRSDPPDVEDVARAGHALASAFGDVVPPLPLTAIAVGGTARALRKVVGDDLTEETLLNAVRRLAKRPSKKIAKEYGVDEARARTMTAGAMIFLELGRRLGTGFRVGRGGLREGAALALLDETEAAVRSA